MRFGMLMAHGPADWQILQQHGGYARVHLDGTFITHPTALERGTPVAVPQVRVMEERDNFACIPWQVCDFSYTTERYAGRWQTELTIPAGGLYRIETMLSTTWENDESLYKPYRGDIRFHLGVGDLFVIAGQSNAVGRAQDHAEDPPDLLVHVLRRCGTWAMAAHPLNESTDTDEPYLEMSMSGTSPYLSFARHYSQMSHLPVGLIPTAQSGSPISRWDTAQSGELYTRMLGQVRNAGGKVRGVLWYQGCNDALDMMQAGSYAAHLKKIFLDFRRDFGEALSIFLFQINRDAAGTCEEGWGLVREAQRQIVHTLPHVWVLPAMWCTLYDSGHNDALSNVLLGEHLARQAAGALLGKPAYEAPDLMAAVQTDSTEVQLRFAHLNGALRLSSDKVLPYGFRVEDSRGKNEISHLKSSDDGVTLTLVRPLEGMAYVSFCDGTNPTFFQPRDPVTGLPPLAFYHIPIT